MIASDNNQHRTNREPTEDLQKWQEINAQGGTMWLVEDRLEPKSSNGW